MVEKKMRTKSSLVITPLQHILAEDNERKVFVWMSPKDFLTLTTSPTRSKGSIKAESHDLDVYNRASENNETLSSPYLRINDTGKVIGHEGRHRAAALIAKKYNRMPVYIAWPKGEKSKLWKDIPNVLKGQFAPTKVSKTKLTLVKDADE